MRLHLIISTYQGRFGAVIWAGFSVEAMEDEFQKLVIQTVLLKNPKFKDASWNKIAAEYKILVDKCAGVEKFSYDFVELSVQAV